MKYKTSVRSVNIRTVINGITFFNVDLFQILQA